MHEIPLNWMPMLIAAAIRVILGMLWYSPIAFGPSFMRLTNCSEEEMKARLPAALASDLVGALIMTFILAHAVYYAGVTSWATGAAVGLFNWLGFIAVTHFSLVMFEKRPFRLFLINNGYQALSLAAMGAVLAVLR
jgi:hypothetical protein